MRGYCHARLAIGYTEVILLDSFTIDRATTTYYIEAQDIILIKILRIQSVQPLSMLSPVFIGKVKQVPGVCQCLVCIIRIAKVHPKHNGCCCQCCCSLASKISA